MGEQRGATFYILAAFFGLFVIFLYGPIITIVILSFQGPQGNLVFPMNGVSLHWFRELFTDQPIGDIHGAFGRSIRLALMVMVLTVLVSVLAGLAYRRRFIGATALFYIAVASLIMPSIVISIGIGAGYELLGWTRSWYSSTLGAHLTWTLPFGLLIMFAVFNRFSPAYEEAARDQGATGWQTIRHVVLPIIAPSLIGVALFGFTLSFDELARSSQVTGDLNTMPKELQALQTNTVTPVIYALGTLTTLISMAVIATCVGTVLIMQARRRRHGSDAGRGV